jgi:Secretion system C-terminal sorting domain
MKAYILTFLFLLFGLSVLGQDIVYDSIIGNKSNWYKVKGGPSEIQLKTYYENQAVITQSKILSAAGVLDALTDGIDYVDITFPYDTLTYEFQTDTTIDMIVYKYMIHDTVPIFFIGLRKAPLGATMFDGQYLFITPLFVSGSQVNIFNGIGSNRSLFLSLNPSNLTDASITDYMLSKQVTVQGFYVSRILRETKTRSVLTNPPDTTKPVSIKSWPNPVSDFFHIEYINNPGIVVRVFNEAPVLVYQNPVSSDDFTINVSSYKTGLYIVVLTNAKTQVIIATIKMMVIHQNYLVQNH